MKECKACGKEVSKSAKTCPNCGQDQRSFFQRHKIITGILVLMVIGVLGALVGGDDEGSSGDTDANEGVVKDSKELVEEVEAEEKEEVKTEYGLDEWWEVSDQWKLKIDSVSFTDERNQFSDKDPEAVVVIQYTYENLGYEGDIQDLFMTPDNVIDGEGKVSESYPAGADTPAKPTPVGATTEGAQESYGLTSSDGEISIHFSKYDDQMNKQKAIFIVPLPNE